MEPSPSDKETRPTGTKDNPTTVVDEVPQPDPQPNLIPQGPGSNVDADSVGSLKAVTAVKAGPNKLVATDQTGKLPTSVLPAGFSGTFAVTGPKTVTVVNGIITSVV